MLHNSYDLIGYILASSSDHPLLECSFPGRSWLQHISFLIIPLSFHCTDTGDSRATFLNRKINTLVSKSMWCFIPQGIGGISQKESKCICWRDYLFSNMLLVPFCEIIIYVTCLCVFCDIGLCVCFGANTMTFLLLWLCSIVEGLHHDASCFTFLAKGYFNYSGSLIFPNEFHDCFFLF